MSKNNSVPFTIDTYRSMVITACANWKITSYEHVKNIDRFVVWRHDCDMSLNRAKFISSLDADLGIQSTFFINLHSTFYNAFELSQTKLIREIVSDGHKIGLHFDYEYLEDCASPGCLTEELIREAQLLERIAESTVGVFSFHNPNFNTAQHTDHEYGGLVNCYSNWMRENVHYSSDSNGYWRHKPTPEVLEDKLIKRLQVLTHPEWWLTEISKPRDRVLRCAYGRAKRIIEEYDSAFDGSIERKNIKSYDETSTDYDRASKMI
jgi:hypothetical protein